MSEQQSNHPAPAAASKTAVSRRWTTRDLIVTAVLSVALGLLLMAYAAFYAVLTPILGSVGIMIALGFFYLPGILVPYIVRKPGAAILASVLAAFTEYLAGSPFGIMAVAAGFFQGLGAEAVFALSGWRRYQLPVLLAASAVSGVFAYAYEYVLFAYHTHPPAIQLGLLLVRIPSALVLAGLLGKVIGDALKRAGVLRGLAISRRDPRP